MSKASEIALLYEKSKTGMLIGLGYLAAKDPVRAIRIGVKVGAHLTNQMLVDSKAYSKIIKEEILEPEAKNVAKWYAANRIPPGTLVSVSPWIPFFLFGGILANIADDIFGGEEQDISGGLGNIENTF